MRLSSSLNACLLTLVAGVLTDSKTSKYEDRIKPVTFDKIETSFQFRYIIEGQI